MDIMDWKTGATFIQSALTILAMIWIWLQQRSRDNSGAIAKLGKRLGELETKQEATDRELKYLPTKEGQHKIELSVLRISGEVQVQGEAIKNSARGVVRIENFLMNKGDK